MLMNQIQDARGDPEALERLYRQAVKTGSEIAFNEAIARYAREHPEDALFRAWVYRLDIQPVDEKGRFARRDHLRQWSIAIVGSVILGAFFVLLAGDRPPIPIPGEANASFWLGWSPLIALGVLLYLMIGDWNGKRAGWYMTSAIAAILLALLTAWLSWGRRDATANLTAIHLPFIIWAVVGGSVGLGHRNVAQQFSAYVLKSVESVLTGGIYLVAGMIFGALTVGMFAVLGITFSEGALQRLAAWGIGIIPILAVASVYSPLSSPMEQDWATGLARILRILTRLMLPPALGVLAVYLFGFIPFYFWRPFREREILIVYNITIMAIIALLISVVPGPDERLSSRYDSILRYGVLATAALTFLLNAYALAAIASRTFGHGLTPNRHTVLGWNIVTLLMLAVVIVRLWRTGTEKWADVVGQSLGRVMSLAIVWALWVLFAVPYLTGQV